MGGIGSGGKKWTLEKVKTTFAEHNQTFMSDVYESFIKKYPVQCNDCKHIRQTSLSYFRHENNKCPICSGSYLRNPKYTLSSVKEICLAHNIEFASDSFSSSKNEYKFRCIECGYVWKNSFKNFNYNCKRHPEFKKCPKCLKRKRYLYQEILEFALNKNFELYVEAYQNQSSKCQLRCIKCGYVTTTTCRAVIKYRRCVRCQGKVKHTLDELRQKSESLNLVCLSTEYKNRTTLYSFQCKVCGTFFQRSYAALKCCPRCTSGFTEEIVRLVAEKFARTKSVKIRPQFLLYKNNKPLEIDIYFDKYKLAIEHDGPHHTKTCIYNNYDSVALEEQIERDNFKNTQCENNGIRLIRIPQLFIETKFDELVTLLKNVFCELGCETNTIIIDKKNILEQAQQNTTKKNNPNKKRKLENVASIKERKKRQQRTHCKVGHKLIGDNIYLKKRENGKMRILCKICRNNNKSIENKKRRERYRRNKENVNND